MKFGNFKVFLLVSLLSIPLLMTSTDPIAEVPARHFLEVVNYSGMTVKLGTYGASGKVDEVGPVTIIRIPDAFNIGAYNFRFTIGYRGHEASLQVNNHEKKGFLYGKQLTIAKNGRYNLERVLILHGKWLLKKPDGRGNWQKWILDLSHLKRAFSGSILLSGTNQKTSIRGRMVGRVVYFTFGAVPGHLKVGGELKITADGIWRGKLYHTTMEKGGKGGYTCNIIKYRDSEKPDAPGWAFQEKKGKVMTVHVGNRDGMYKSIFIRLYGTARWNKLWNKRPSIVFGADNWNDTVKFARQSCEIWKKKSGTSKSKRSQIPLTIKVNYKTKELVVR